MSRTNPSYTSSKTRLTRDCQELFNQEKDLDQMRVDLTNQCCFHRQSLPMSL